MITKVSEETALRDAFEEQIRLMFGVFVEGLITPNLPAHEVCQNFRRGLAITRAAYDSTSAIIAEKDAS